MVGEPTLAAHLPWKSLLFVSIVARTLVTLSIRAYGFELPFTLHKRSVDVHNSLPYFPPFLSSFLGFMFVWFASLYFVWLSRLLFRLLLWHLQNSHRDLL
jgi:hypothetical protein